MCHPAGGRQGTKTLRDEVDTGGGRRCRTGGRSGAKLWPVSTSAAPSLRTDLGAIVGAEHVLVDDDVRAGYEVDWTGRWTGRAEAVVRPGSVDEVTGVLRWCNERGVAVVTQAGNTGLVGGGVPRVSTPTDSIVLSMRRFDRLGPCDQATQQVTAGAGVTVAAWRTHARAAGLDVPVDFAARDSATVGGAIATNAGGSRVLRFGTMRSQVVGIEAVLADGTVVGSLSGLPKETAGLHWPSVLSGSEGTLAVVTAARLRLVPRYHEVVTALVATESMSSAAALLARVRAGVPSLDSVEVMTNDAVDLVGEQLGITVPGTPTSDRPVWVLIECADHRDPTDDLAAVLDGADGIGHVVVATDGPARERLTALRDRMTEAIAAAAVADGVPVFKLDVAVPVDRLDELLTIATRAAAADGARLLAFGHLAEGNLHLNHLGANDTERLADTVLRAVADLGGTISAEHGIGVAKAPWLPLIRSAGDLAAQRAIRSALDPHGILNPGVLTPDPPQPNA